MSNDGALLHQKYDIFISFRGVDVRNNFLSHLYCYLNDSKKFTVYMDDQDLERGVQISPSLLQSIEGSAIYIVIFSPNYADSRWCLDELVKILECSERLGRRVIPVFYGGVDPSHVQNQSGSYGVPFAGRYKKLPAEMSGKVQSWRTALTEAAGIAGFDSQVIWPEARLIEEISKAVFQAIGNQMMVPISYSDRGLIGLETKMQDMEWLLSLDTGDNRAIGLWGMGGIGKTTLAKAIYDRFSCQFESSYFLHNFADQLRHSPHLFGDLQDDLFSKLLGDENGGSRMSHDLRLERLGRTRSLVVIDGIGDDMGSIGLLKGLLNGQYSDLFGPGSKIVMTSRNKQLLHNVCHWIYEVGALGDDEALKLFSLHAVKQTWPPIEYKEMSMRAVSYADGNPLALTVLGSHLYGRDQEFWDRELNSLKNNPDPAVDGVLRRSYNGLSKTEKDLFLDLACFHDYWYKITLEKIEKMLLDEGSGNDITNLIDKSLLRLLFSGSSNISMSKLLQDLGRSIVDEEHRTEKRSRLWKVEDLYDIITQRKGTESIEGIFWNQARKMQLQPNSFSKMENLRFLVIRGGPFEMVPSVKCLPNFTTVKIGLPNALRILEWNSFPSKCFSSQFYPHNLVSLDMKYSNMEQLWRGADNVDLGNLKFLTLIGSSKLRKLPNLTRAKRLEEINLSDCWSLVELPSSILDLPKLNFLDVSSCFRLKWNNLEYCAAGGQDHSTILPSLKKLFPSWTSIKKVPTFISQLHVLELDCKDCTNLTAFPVIRSLERLKLTGSLIKEVNDLDELMGLKWLRFDFNKQLIRFSNDFCKLKSLRGIDLTGCSRLKQFPDILETMGDLVNLDLSRCSSLTSLPGSIGNLIHLKRLYLSYTAIEELPPSIGGLTRLSKLLLNHCKSLACLPNTIHKIPNLETLHIFGCDQLSHLPELPSSLKNLDAHGCKSLQSSSIAIEKHDLSKIDWNFSRCGKLDSKMCSKLVEKTRRNTPHPILRCFSGCIIMLKFAQDSVRSYGYSRLLLPGRQDSNDGTHGEGRISGSANSIVTAEFRGQPWKSPKSLIFCALLNYPPAFENDAFDYHIECALLNNGSQIVVSSCSWTCFPEHEDEDQEHCLKPNDLLVWKDRNFDGTRAVQLASKRNDNDNDDDDSATVTFLFRGKRKGREIPGLIHTGWVIPVYDDRPILTYDDDDDDDDDVLQRDSTDDMIKMYSSM